MQAAQHSRRCNSFCTTRVYEIGTAAIRAAYRLPQVGAVAVGIVGAAHLGQLTDALAEEVDEQAIEDTQHESSTVRIRRIMTGDEKKKIQHLQHGKNQGA
ncbi:hypothetical protein [Streptomyces chumphonensis]|uniref:hypothetical protein n=1 Tax=Streptomyces chumphonensis TaxID=1214925 RepID=UPI003D707C68